MKRRYTQFISFVLAAVMLLGMAPVVSEATTMATTDKDQTVTYDVKAEDRELVAVIEPQIRAYADTIDQKGADNAAAQIVANHGMSAKGAELIVGEDHVLTATLMNSELMQVGLGDVCAEMITDMRQISPKESLYAYGEYGWYGTEKSRYIMNSYDSEENEYETRVRTLIQVKPFAGERNAYDESLDWIAGGVRVQVKMELVGRAGGEELYDVTVRSWDRFDFSTNGKDEFKNLISGLGALLFREFDWESTVTFQVTVPVDEPCTHTSASYRWTFDAASKEFTSDGTSGYTQNGVAHYSYVNSAEKTVHYHKLDETVRLFHDEPWVLEYDAKSHGSIVLAPNRYMNTRLPSLLIGSRSYLAFRTHSYTELTNADQNEFDTDSESGTTYYYYGSLLSKLFTYPSKPVCTFRLENVTNADGSNMVYFSVYNAETGELLLDRTAMDDYYGRQVWKEDPSVSATELTDWTSGNNWVSGKDLFINYIGSRSNPFTPSDSCHFELRIWENGKDTAPQSYYKAQAVEPTCTEQGYTAQICSACGEKYDVQYAPAKGHSFGEWYTVTAATCDTAGQEQRDCAVCGIQETRENAASGHQYVDTVIAPTCASIGYTTHTCTVCGESFSDAYTAVGGHSVSQWTVTTPVTCTVNGMEQGTCTICGIQDTREIKALGHSYGSTVTAATCTEQGYTTYTCAACGDSYMDAYVDALGHSAVMDEAVAASCEQSGLTEGSHCGRCGVVLTAQETIPATGHQFADDRDSVCDVCGYEREAAFLLGDADGSGAVDFFDGMIVLQYYAGLIDETQLDLRAANVDNISDVNFFDGMMILQHYADIIDLHHTNNQ